ncbi:MAG: DUF2079 domain-containing protein, partial [Propionibacteriaceae bacterium]
FSIRRHYDMFTAGYDLGIFHQVISAYSKFQAPIVTLKGPNYNIFGDHFHPILVLLTPLYWIWHSPVMLLLAQAALIASSIPLVFSFAKRHWGTNAAGLLALGYGLGWPIQKMIEFDFHEVCFAVPLLALAIDGLDTKRDRRLLIAGILLLFVREDMGLIVFLIGFLRLFRKPRLPAWTLMILGPLFLIVTTKYIVPAFNPTKTFAYWDYTQLGPDAPHAVMRMLINPWVPATLWFWPPIKLLTQLMFLVPLLFLCLRSPYVILSFPFLAQRFFSDRRLLWYPAFHYNAPIWIIVTLAAIDGAERMRDSKRAWARWWGNRSRHLTAWWCAIFMLVGTCVSSYAFPLGRTVKPSFWQYDEHQWDKIWVLAYVTPGTCLAADDQMIPPKLGSNAVRQVHPEDRWADFIVLDFDRPDPGYRLPSTAASYNLALTNGYQLVARAGSVVLMRRDDYFGPTPGCRP